MGNMPSLRDKTLVISGGSRGIGEAIALRAAADGANVVIMAKTGTPHPKLPGTIHTVADKIRKAGGQALGLQVDIRFEDQIRDAVDRIMSEFGGLDILINNASAINLTGTLATPLKRFDLMFGVNVRGTFACSQACLPYIKDSANPHILNLAPPLNLNPRWFKDHVAYTISKYGMSMCVLGMAEEFRSDSVGVNALWPRTVIHTAALAMLGGVIQPDHCRSPEIMADAAHAILIRDSRKCTGNFFIDEEVLAEEGVTDLSRYAVGDESQLMTDLFLD